MVHMEVRVIRSPLPRLTLELLALGLLLASCTKSKVGDELKRTPWGSADYWGQPAGPEEQLTPGFSETAARLYSALEQERQKLSVSEVEFDQFQPTVKQQREETRKAVRSRVDRDLDFLLESYAGKLDMLRNYRRLRDGTEYLPALHQQLDECHADLVRLFTAYPMPRPSAFGPHPLGPCMKPVPRAE
jgi:hypothetical protein